MLMQTKIDDLLRVMDNSRFGLAIAAAKRARQLQGGARPFLPITSKKATVTAMEEVKRGLVKYEDPAARPAETPAPEAFQGSN